MGKHAADSNLQRQRAATIDVGRWYDVGWLPQPLRGLQRVLAWGCVGGIVALLLGTAVGLLVVEFEISGVGVESRSRVDAFVRMLVGVGGLGFGLAGGAAIIPVYLAKRWSIRRGLDRHAVSDEADVPVGWQLAAIGAGDAKSSKSFSVAGCGFFGFFGLAAVGVAVAEASSNETWTQPAVIALVIGVVLLMIGFLSLRWTSSAHRGAASVKCWGKARPEVWNPGSGNALQDPIAMRAVRLAQAYRIIRRTARVLLAVLCIVAPLAGIAALVDEGPLARGSGVLTGVLITVASLVLLCGVALDALRRLVLRDVAAHAQLEHAQLPDIEVLLAASSGGGPWAETAWRLELMAVTMVVVCATGLWVGSSALRPTIDAFVVGLIAALAALILGTTLSLVGARRAHLARRDIARRWP